MSRDCVEMMDGQIIRYSFLQSEYEFSHFVLVIACLIILHSSTTYNAIPKLRYIQQRKNNIKQQNKQDGPQIRNILPIHPHDNLRLRGSTVHYIRNILCLCDV